MATFTNKARALKKLRAVPVAARKAMRQQLRANAVELVATMKGFAPVEDGDLRESIDWHDTSDASRISVKVTAGSRKAFYGVWVEFGHGNAAPRPFFWPAYRLKRRRFKSRISRAVKKAIAGAVT